MEGAFSFRAKGTLLSRRKLIVLLKFFLQPYEDLYKADADRYEKEMKSVLNKTVKRSASP
jgi:hypothetical protein